MKIVLLAAACLFLVPSISVSSDSIAVMAHLKDRSRQLVFAATSVDQPKRLVVFGGFVLTNDTQGLFTVEQIDSVNVEVFEMLPDGTEVSLVRGTLNKKQGMFLLKLPQAVLERKTVVIKVWP